MNRLLEKADTSENIPCNDLAGYSERVKIHSKDVDSHVMSKETSICMKRDLYSYEETPIKADTSEYIPYNDLAGYYGRVRAH